MPRHTGAKRARLVVEELLTFSDMAREASAEDSPTAEPGPPAKQARRSRPLDSGAAAAAGCSSTQGQHNTPEATSPPSRAAQQQQQQPERPRVQLRDLTTVAELRISQIDGAFQVVPLSVTAGGHHVQCFLKGGNLVVSVDSLRAENLTKLEYFGPADEGGVIMREAHVQAFCDLLRPGEYGMVGDSRQLDEMRNTME